MSQEQANPDQILALPGFDDEPAGAVGGSLPPWWRRRSTIIGLAIFLLIVLLAAILIPRFTARQPVTYQYQNVTRGSIALTVSATGPIQSGIYNLIFTGSGGKINAIYVKVGQAVKKGDKLAQLDPTALQDALAQEQAAYIAAQNSYNSTANIYNQTTGQSQASINAAQTSLNNAMSALTKTLAQSQATVNGAIQTLNNDQQALNTTQQTSQDSINSAQTALSNDQKALQAAQQQASANNAAAQQGVTNAQNAFNNAQNQEGVAYQQQQIALKNCALTPIPNTTPPPSYSNCTQTADAAYLQAQANVTTAQNALDAARKQLSSTQAASNVSITAAQAHVNTDQKALTTAQDQAQSDNQAAQSKISSDQAALTSAQTNSAANNNAAQNSVNTAQSGLKSAQASASTTNASSQGQLTSAQGQLNDALAALTTAKHNLQNALLTAPHDGIVTTINGTVGSAPGVPPNASTSSTTTAGATFIQLVDVSALQVQANINETDTANLKAGDAVSFTVSAYGNRAFKGTVSAISPNGQTISNVVTYPVSVDVDMSNANLHDATLLPGMTANLTVTVLKRDNVLTIPVDAVNFARLATAGASTATASSRTALVSRQGANSALRQARQRLVELTNQTPSITNDNPLAAYVLEQSNGQFVIKPVVLGLTDGTVYEVLDGLNENETIVVGSSGGAANGG